jgi:predicted RND superfamily exporter protein
LDAEKEVRALLGDVNRVLKPYREAGTRFAIAGWPVTTYYMGEYMEADARVFMPISLILTLGTIWFVFRNIRLLLLACVGIVLTLMATLGLAGMVGITLNNASIAVIPLVMALALSDIVHIFTHLHRSYLQEGGGVARGGLREILRAILFPCLLTSVNTGIGFFSYTFNSVAAIRSFGWLAAAGMMFEFIVTFGFVAPLLAYLSPEKIYRDPDVHQRQGIPRLLSWVHNSVTRRPWWPFLLCVAGLVVSGWFAKNIKVNTNLEELFEATSVLRQDIDYVRTHLAGMESITVVFESTRDAFKDPARLTHIDEITQEIKRIPEVESVIGFGEYLKEMNKAFHGEDQAYYRLPATRNMVEQFLLLYGRDDLDDVVTPGFDVARITVRANVPSSSQSRETIERIQEVLNRHPLPGATATITGGVALGVRTMDVMVEDQVNNIGQTVIVIWLIMVGVLRSWGLALLFLVPNLFPIAVNFGIMGYFGIPLDTGTSLIAASAFGIIVDDTVHFFTVFGQHRRQGLTIKESLDKTSSEKGEAMFSSFLIMGMGFGVLLMSKFQPLIMFGLLNIIILLVGMIGDQVFLKSILALWSRHKK